MPRRDSPTITVAPSVLRWARERAALDRNELAKRVALKPARVAAWEESGQLKFAYLQRLADKTHTPVGYLFLPEPPTERLPIADFRRPGGAQPETPSPDLLDTIYQCQQRQAWYREFAQEVGAARVSFVGSVTVEQPPEVVAAAIRRALNLDDRPTSVEPTWEAALDELYRRIEDLGVLAMRNGIVGTNTHRPLHVEEFRGFALSDPYAPVLFVNSTDAKSAQMFTLIHELTHLWLGHSAVSDADPRTTRPEERFCNQVAAEVLVPAMLFRHAWDANAGAGDEVARLSRVFKVSQYVVLIRALDAALLTRPTFERLWAAQEERAQDAPKKESGGHFYYTQRSRLGPRFARAVVVSALEGRTPYTEAFRLLNVRKGSTFDEMARTLGVVP